MTQVADGMRTAIRLAKMPAIVPVLTAGGVGLAVWEGFSRIVAPLWLGFALDPTGLIEMSIGLTGMAATLLHIFTGLVIFPAAYLLLVQPIVARLAPGMPWIAVALGYGAALWVFAMYGMASLLGGMPPFLGFSPIAWASLIGHLGLAVGIAATAAAWRGARA